MQDTGNYQLSGYTLTVSLRILGAATTTLDRTGSAARITQSDGTILTSTSAK